MKKLLLLAIMAFTLSCSKDDEPDPNTVELAKTWENVAGTWRIANLTRANGAVENYVSVCADLAYKINIQKQFPFNSNAIWKTETCALIDEQNTRGEIVNGRFFQIAGDLLDDALLESVKANEFTIVFDNPNSKYEFVGIAKKVTFIRQ